MRNIRIVAAAAAAVCLVSSPVNAAHQHRGQDTSTSGVTSLAPTVEILTPAAATTVTTDPIDSAILNTYGTDNFGATLTGTGSFSNTFNFTIDADSIANSQVSTIDLSGIGVDFTSILLDSTPFTQSSSNPETWVLSPAVGLLSGAHNLFVNGTVGSGGSGSYSGNINLTAPGAVPEPATWAMMLFGFAGVGMTLRRRKRLLPQIA